MAIINSSSDGGIITGLTKKLLLWLIVIMQICFIGTFWLLQGTTLDDNAALPVSGTKGERTNGRLAEKPDLFLLARLRGNRNNLFDSRTPARVHFVTKAQRQKPNESLKRQQNERSSSSSNGTPLKNVNNFTKDFFILKTNRLMNATGNEGFFGMEEAEIANEIWQAERLERDKQGDASVVVTQPVIWCFRQGALNSSTSPPPQNEINELDIVNNWSDIVTTENLRCRCEEHWHARDCGQPEIIWRALMLAKGQLKLRDLDTKGTQMLKPHYLVYFLEGYFYSLDLLELQIKSVIEVVDYFVVYWTNHRITHNDLKALQHRLKELLSSERYTLYYCKSSLEESGRGTIPKGDAETAATCSTKYAYKYFRKQMKNSMPLKSSDLLLYTRDREILLQPTLKFLKYYASEAMQSVLRFRLKYNVYGFYWQHTKRTTLSAAISSFAQLDSADVGNGNPSKLLQTTSNVITIGDLNHFGGWFCQYCQHPEEIIKEFQNAGRMTNSKLPGSPSQVQFPNDTRNHLIDGDFVQQLIARGLYIDGKTQLIRLRQHSDKYYAPNHALDCNWKFGNLLTNFYENLDDDLLDDN